MTATNWTEDLRSSLDERLDAHRSALQHSLDGLTDQEARARLVPSKTTLLGLLQHVTYVEAIWFGQAVTGASTRELGVASSPDRSFVLRRDATIASVRAAHADRCAESRATMAGFALDDEVSGRGARPVWALYLQVLGELAQHAGHADVLREQLLAARERLPA
ncbi:MULTISPECIES: DinB family protein [unclassified Modestobacter]|uniref:DinB family protein n=1 Tax=unclassified Modestobacter TaxID=2643866 RepID=UPI0022AA3E33|nr:MULTISPECIES: DinB family protein [unclassified Modestobacter]MCZ2826895.1 DinB family protein [Modestobacter sp. VKM Ac-2981]MCZ2855409.1 DinB family protein [Modestobacter sp. VKM Ac-2982]